jgi:ankyrin repeat protein
VSGHCVLQSSIRFDIQEGYHSCALHAASRKGYKKVVRLLLEKSSDIKAKDSSGWTVLDGAAMGGHEAVVGLPVEKGANIGAKDLDG